MKEFFAMGGYAFYVWTSIALSAVVMFINIASAVRRRKKLVAKVKYNIQSTNETARSENES